MDMTQLLEGARRIDLKIGVFPVHEYWRDVDMPHDLSSAQRLHEVGEEK